MFTDRTALRTEAYAGHGPLTARLSIYDFQQDRVDLPGLAVAGLANVRGTVLDAGLRARHLRPTAAGRPAGPAGAAARPLGRYAPRGRR